jgi:tetratricopeptide (TPR) repeat protein
LPSQLATSISARVNFKAAELWLDREAARGCHSLANYYLGEISRAEDQLKKAESLYVRALRCDSTNVDAHLHLGMLLEAEKQYSRAITQYKQVIKLQPNTISAHYHLASVYRAIWRRADSAAEFGRVRQIQALTGNGVDITKQKQH